jgi:hypothetical protein
MSTVTSIKYAYNDPMLQMRGISDGMGFQMTNCATNMSHEDYHKTLGLSMGATGHLKQQKIDKKYPMGTRVDGVYDNTNYCVPRHLNKTDTTFNYVQDGDVTWQDFVWMNQGLNRYLTDREMQTGKSARETDPVMARNFDQMVILGNYIKAIGKWDDFKAGKYVVNVDPSENISALAPQGEGMMDMYYIPDELSINQIPAAALPYYNKMMKEMEVAEMPVGDITNPDKNNDGVSDDPKKAVESMDKAQSYDEREFFDDVKEKGELSGEISDWAESYLPPPESESTTDYTTYILIGAVVLGGVYFYMNSNSAASAPPPPVPQ